MIRPSSLPMLAQCSAFESSGSDFAELGTQRHAALHAHYNGDDALLGELDDESQQGIRWACDFIRANSTESYPVEWETRRTWMRPDLTEASGTPDVTNGPTLFDFKWRQRNYTAQLADYALWCIEQGFPTVTVYVLYGSPRWTEKITFDIDACEKVILPILERAENPTPTPCDYCGWCAKRLTCKALTGPAATVGAGYAEPGLLDITNWRPSEMMSDPAQMAFALTLARKVLKKWIESVEFHALEAAIKNGLKLPGYELKTRAGNKFVADVEKAYEASGLPAAEFLKCCAVRLNTSKTKPELKGLDVAFKEAGEPSLAAAKRKVTAKLGDLILHAKEINQLKSTKSSDDDETE